MSASGAAFLPSDLTKRIRLGPLVYLLTLYSPLRLIEEICILDHLCRGRLDVGVGRGVSPFRSDQTNSLGTAGLSPDPLLAAAAYRGDLHPRPSLPRQARCRRRARRFSLPI